MNKNNNTSGIGLSGILTTIFIVLKLVGVINWSWWWVFAPTWINLILVILIILGMASYNAYIETKYGSRSKKDKWKF